MSFGTYQRLMLPASATNREVVRAASFKLIAELRHARRMRKERHKFYRQMLAYHKDAQRLVREWRL